jgi:predicted nucleic acid-binding protein
MAAIVIADASPLIALARVGGLSWLQQLFTEVMLTTACQQFPHCTGGD